MRKMLTIVAATALLSMPAQAADLQGGSGETRTGGFVGARLQLALDARRPTRPRASLAIAPTQSHRAAAGGVVTRFGEGVALDFTGPKPSLMVAGRPAAVALGLREQGRVGSGRKLGMSTTGWIAIGAAVTVALAVLAVTQLTCVGEDTDYCGSD
jgi:hypothetical protein